MTVMAMAQSCFGKTLTSIENTDLYAIENGKLTALMYCNEILDQFVRPYAGSIGQEFILMDDDARPLRAHITNAYLEHEASFICLITGFESD